MRRGHGSLVRACVLLLVAHLVFVLSSAQAHARPPRPSALRDGRRLSAGCTLSLTVRVFDDASAEPLSRAHVAITSAARHRRVRVGSPAFDSKLGAYVVRGLCTGTYSVTVVHEGYETRSTRVRLPRSTPLDIALSAQIQRLDDVVVEAPAMDAPSMRASATLQGDALDRTRGLQLADSLATISGVDVLRSGVSAKPIVRGQFGRRLLTLFDGVRHESQKWGLDHAPEIDPFAAGRLTVIKGAAGVRYGPDAVGGAILVDPHPLLIQPGYAGEVQLVGASNGRRGTVALRVDGAPARLAGLAWRLEGNLTRGAGLLAPNYPLDNTGVLSWNVGATVRYERAGYSAKLAYRRHFTKNGVFSGLRSESVDDFRAQLDKVRPSGSERYRSDYPIERPYQQVAHDLMMLRVAGPTGGAGALTLTYAYQRDDRDEFDTVKASTKGPQFDFLLQTHTLDAVFEHRALAIGTTRWRLRGSAGLFGMIQDNRYAGLPLIPNYQQISGGVFAIERLVRSSVEIEAGLRFDHVARRTVLGKDAFGKHQSQGRISDDDCDQLANNSYACPTAFSALTVSAGALWRFARGFTAKLDASSAARAPVVDEQYIDGTAPTSPVLAVGAPLIGKETTWGLSATVSGMRRNISFEVSTYANLIDNYIYFAPALQADGTPKIDVIGRGAFPRFEHRAIDALFWGIDGGLTVGADFPLQLDIQAAMVWAEQLGTGAYLVFVPPFRLRTTLKYKPPKIWRLFRSFIAVSGTFVARQNRFDDKADFAPPPRGYALLGVSVGTQIRMGQQLLKVGLEARNLLNTRYRNYTSLLRYFADEPGFDLFLRLSLAFRHAP